MRGKVPFDPHIIIKKGWMIMTELFSSASSMWLLFGTVLIFFMQAGFAMLECGFGRSKNAGNIVMKNLLDFTIGTCVFWLLGFGIMFGKGNGFFGWLDLTSSLDYSHILPAGIPFSAFFIFQTVFCATSATIVSGAMAERTKFESYCILCAVIALIAYPVTGHWIWGGGWLSSLGFQDFAGSSAVHLAGGTAALIGALVLGPRIGKYDSKGNSKAMPGHNLPLAALGIFILWMGWFGFCGASTKSMEGTQIQTAASIFVNVNLSAAFSTCTVMLITRARYGKSDISMTINGALAGLVISTGCCAYIEPVGAALIGILAGALLVPSLELVDKKLHIDDPVGAVSVHGVMGFVGTLLTGLLSLDTGLFYGGGFRQLGIQLLGAVSVIAWTALVISLTLLLLKNTLGIRVSAKEEIAGLDMAAHGLVSAYPDFAVSTLITSGILSDYKESMLPDNADKPVSLEAAVPVDYAVSPDSNPLPKVEIIMKQERFEALKNALNEVGVTGMTVTQVFGCGIQKGQQEFYRGTEMDMQLLPKIRVEIVLAKVPVNDVVNAARRVLYTGHIGDGKIFISHMDNAVKIRTGEQGYDAMQGNDE